MGLKEFFSVIILINSLLSTKFNPFWIYLYINALRLFCWKSLADRSDVRLGLFRNCKLYLISVKRQMWRYIVMGRGFGRRKLFTTPPPLPHRHHTTTYLLLLPSPSSKPSAPSSHPSISLSTKPSKASQAQFSYTTTQLSFSNSAFGNVAPAGTHILSRTKLSTVKGP